MKQQRHNRKNDRRRGTVTVEFALMVPIAFLLTFGLVEFTRVNMIRNTAQNAVYQAARAAIIPGGTAADAKAEANSILSIVRVNNAAVTVEPATITRSTRQIEVSISIPLGQNLWVTPRYFSHQTMVKKCVLTRESTQSGY